MNVGESIAKTKPILENIETIRCNLNESYERLYQINSSLDRLSSLTRVTNSKGNDIPVKDTPWDEKTIEQKLIEISTLSTTVDNILRDLVARINDTI